MQYSSVFQKSSLSEPVNILVSALIGTFVSDACCAGYNTHAVKKKFYIFLKPWGAFVFMTSISELKHCFVIHFFFQISFGKFAITLIQYNPALQLGWQVLVFKIKCIKQLTFFVRIILDLPVI